ncbi:general transcription factor 3C polypeptide 4 [Trichomycterus rosablanca]|uniref:general transcription factor 3C polypeptide 4 n=1 Tax=Trichomycterus rosablanca TaxID=2290929 RepID=UPI002F356A53
MAALEAKQSGEEAEEVFEETPGPEDDYWAGLGPVVKREPVVKLMSVVSGLEVLTWSEDHRVAASTINGVTVLEMMCDLHTQSPDLVFHRTFISVPESACEIKVGSEEEVKKVKQKFENSEDPEVMQLFMLDRIMNPQGGALQGMKYTSWSPLGCDVNGRCVLACLTLDGRLTIQSGHKRLQWTELMDLTELYGDMLKSRNYTLQTEGVPERALDELQDLEELQNRYQMQTPVRMEWSSRCSTQHIQNNNECKAVETVLLAVLMENGDLVVWQFRLPVQGKDSVVSCNTIKSGVALPSVLAWWEYEHDGRRMSGLIVGSTTGPVKILPVNLKAVRGYFTLRQPVVLWQETDKIPVSDIKCVSFFHPKQKCNCSLVVVARGPYVFWCLLLISRAGLNVHNSHVTGLHSAPITSLGTSRSGGSIFTCSLDGTVKKLTPVFTDAAVVFKQQEVELPEGVRGRRIHGIAVSPNSAYLALASTEGMTNGLHPVTRNYLVQFITLKMPDEAGSELLESPLQNLYKKADLLDLLRWRVARDKRIPQSLLDELDEKAATSNSMYFWRLKLFLLRILHRSMQKAPVKARWKPSHEESKTFLGDETEEGDTMEGSRAAETTLPDESKPREAEGESEEERMNEVIAWIEGVESYLMREHMKKVLGEVYLHTNITENTCIPTKGICDFLSTDPTSEDRAAEVLIGHINNKINKQTFPEHCSLCKEVLPFADCRQASCTNGHVWYRCGRTFQACQSVTYRRCLLRDSLASLPQPEDPEWVKKILNGVCIFCDSPLV